jgi:aldose 1-epimerase
MPRVTRAPFGTDAHGRAVECVTLRNTSGTEVEVLSLGGIIRAVRVPDRHGQHGDVVLGYDDVASYESDPFYLGALIGRYGNRIGGGTFTLDGHRYTLPQNNGANTLHGGPGGLHAHQWDVETFADDTAAGVHLTLTSPDGDQGFPGTVQARVTYTWRDDHALVVDYAATTTAPTPLNLTQHSYFNLSAGASPTVLGHTLLVHASRFTVVDEALIPTGELRAVDGTPFDFRFPRAVGERIRARDAQLAIGRGYDHNWVLDHASGARLEAVRLHDPVSGRELVIATTEPGVQVYSGNYLGDGRVGKQGAPIGANGGIALETQHFPDSPNQPAFPSTIVRPEAPYRSSTVFAFRVTT